MKAKKGVVGALLIFLVLNSGAQDQYKESAPPQDNGKFKTDLEFARMLQNDWLKLESAPGLVRDSIPKPSEMPVAGKSASADKLRLGGQALARPTRPIPPAQPKHSKVPPPARKGVSFDYFGAPLKVAFEGSVKVPIRSEINNATISAWWEATAGSNYEPCLQQAQEYRQQMRLNDWGYAYLLYKMGETIYPKSADAADLFTWFMMVKSGFNAKVGYGNGQVCLLLPSENVQYGVPHFALSDQQFYLAPFDARGLPAGSLFICEGNYPEADLALDLRILETPNIEASDLEKIFRFAYGGKEYSIPVKFNKPLVDYFENYPQTDLEVYFSAPLSPQADSSLLKALRPMVEGKLEAERVNFLLHFVQSLAYKTDAEQFGREKYLFPEETLYYSYSDCEDRAVFFACLVRELTGLEVIGLDYPGHVATAIRFPVNLPGDTVTYAGQRYLICDPTYLNAGPGMCQPKYRDVQPSVIEIEVSEG